MLAPRITKAFLSKPREAQVQRVLDWMQRTPAANHTRADAEKWLDSKTYTGPQLKDYPSMTPEQKREFVETWIQPDIRDGATRQEALRRFEKTLSASQRALNAKRGTQDSLLLPYELLSPTAKAKVDASLESKRVGHRARQRGETAADKYHYSIVSISEDSFEKALRHPTQSSPRGNAWAESINSGRINIEKALALYRKLKAQNAPERITKPKPAVDLSGPPPAAAPSAREQAMGYAPPPTAAAVPKPRAAAAPKPRAVPPPPPTAAQSPALAAALAKAAAAKETALAAAAEVARLQGLPAVAPRAAGPGAIGEFFAPRAAPKPARSAGPGAIGEFFAPRAAAVPKGKRAPSAYNQFVGEQMRNGSTMAEAAAAWKAMKP